MIQDLESPILNAEQKTTPHNRAILMDRLAMAEAAGDFGSHFPPCAAVHPWFDSCPEVQLDRCVSVMQWMAPIVS